MKFLETLYYFLFPIKLHWYQIRVIYSKNNIMILSNLYKIGRKKQEEILDERKIKQSLGDMHKNPILKPHLCNGLLAIEVISYLGYFNQKSKYEYIKK